MPAGTDANLGVGGEEERERGKQRQQVGGGAARGREGGRKEESVRIQGTGTHSGDPKECVEDQAEGHSKAHSQHPNLTISDTTG